MIEIKPECLIYLVSHCQLNLIFYPARKVNSCDDPVSVTASIDVPDLHISWSHTYTSDDTVEVPGFTASVPGFLLSGGVYLQVSLTPDGERLRLTVSVFLTSYKTCYEKTQSQGRKCSPELILPREIC